MKILLFIRNDTKKKQITNLNTMTKHKFLIPILIAVFAVGHVSAQEFKSEDILGLWFNEEKDAKIGS